MTKHRRTARGTVGLALALFVVGWAAFGPVSTAGAQDETFTFTMDGTVASGAHGQQVTATITNGSDTVILGSANIDAPSGFTITDASFASLPSDTASVTFTGSQVQLRGLGLSFQGTAVVNITATAACGADGDNATWSAVAKEDPNFGDTGVTFSPNPALSDTTYSGQCHLTFLNQPAGAEKNATITAANFNPGGDRLQVEVDDATGAVIANTSATLSLAIGTNPGGGTLSGSSPVSFSGGVATFAPSINKSGFGYTLVASASGGGVIDPATSDSFKIYDKVCHPGQPCSANGPQGNLNTNIQSSSSAGNILLAFDAEPTPNCGDTFNHLPNTVTIDTFSFTGTGNKKATFKVAKSFDQIQPNNGAKFYQLCYSSPTPFKDRSGNIVTTGLLPDCPKNPVAPCVQSRTKSGSGAVLVTAQLPPNDPRVH